jgi:leader peptidase (prepilin peptidase) / N-methyltransferase
VGTIDAIVISVAAGISAGVIGWWFRASTLARRWVEDARTSTPTVYGQVPSGTPILRAAWPIFSSFAATSVTAALLFGRTAPTLMVTYLMVWACGVVLLALVDRETLLLPRQLMHVCAFVTGGVLLADAAVTRDWDYLGRSALSSLVTCVIFGAWAFAQPNSLGLGDARMAGLVALGAGGLSPADCVAALACAPLIAASISSLRWRYRRIDRSIPMALGPFLALAGIVAVVGSAI